MDLDLWSTGQPGRRTAAPSLAPFIGLKPVHLPFVNRDMSEPIVLAIAGKGCSCRRCPVRIESREYRHRCGGALGQLVLASPGHRDDGHGGDDLGAPDARSRPHRGCDAGLVPADEVGVHC